MKIIILGAGQVGGSLALSLAREANDITLVDMRADVLDAIKDRADLRTVVGHAAHPDILEQAGAADASMLIALTSNDETNMVACQVAYTLFHTPTKIARIRSTEYLKYTKLFAQEALPIDVLISPELLVSQYVQRLIEHPGALQVLDFSGGRVKLVAARAFYGGPLVGHELRTINKRIPGVQTRVAAIFRHGRAILPEGHTVIEADDEVFFLAAAKHIDKVTNELHKHEKPYKRILIAGGGNIGSQLAATLEHKYQVKVIERNTQRSLYLSEVLNKTIVLNGDSADQELLLEENVDSVDVFCALTNDDEANILSAMLAKRLGARKVMSLINRPSYAELVESGIIDIAISPQQVTIGTLLTHIRRGDVVAVHSLRRGAAEAIEAIAHGDPKTSSVVGKTVDEVKLPKGATIAAIVRGDEVVIAHHDTVIESEDHVILFLIDKKRIAEVEKLFQVGITFL